MVEVNESWDKYARLEERKRELEEELDSVKGEMSGMEKTLLEFMTSYQMDKITIRGITFSPRRRIFAGPAPGHDRSEVADALIENGLGDFVKNDYNANALSGYVSSFNRESDSGELTTAEIQGKLPEGLRDVIQVSEKWSIAAVKSGKKAR